MLNPCFLVWSEKEIILSILKGKLYIQGRRGISHPICGNRKEQEKVFVILHEFEYMPLCKNWHNVLK